jgi:alkylhydroperoxidase family enzyme
MPRIPYLPLDLSEPADIVEAIRARRGGTLLNLDRLLLYSPEIARGWNQHLGAIRTRLSLSPRLRELAMLVVAVLNRAPYEFVHHAPVYLQAGGTQAQLDALADPDQASTRADLFDETERAALAVAISLTREVRIDDDTFERLRAKLNERELVEYVITVAAYNMVSRILVAFGVEPEH